MITGYFKDNADDSTIDAVGDYSVTPGSYRFKVPAGTSYRIEQVEVIIQDGAIVNTSYGAIAGRTTAFQLAVNRSTISQSLTGGVGTAMPHTGGWVNSHEDFLKHCEITEVRTTSLNCTFDFTDLPGGGLVLKAADYMEIYMNENLSFLQRHQFTCRGTQLYGPAA